MNINDKRFMFGEIYKIKPTCTVGWRFIDNFDIYEERNILCQVF